MQYETAANGRLLVSLSLAAFHYLNIFTSAQEPTPSASSPPLPQGIARHTIPARSVV